MSTISVQLSSVSVGVFAVFALTFPAPTELTFLAPAGAFGDVAFDIAALDGLICLPAAGGGVAVEPPISVVVSVFFVHEIATAATIVSAKMIEIRFMLSLLEWVRPALLPAVAAARIVSDPPLGGKGLPGGR
jgi:hypothetical protein